MDADVIIVGAGLAGLVACHELVSAGKRVAVVDQENAANLGGQAFWSFGGIFMVDTPMQRRLGIRDSFELAWQDWQGSAAWDRLDGEDGEDIWAARWGRAFVEFAAGEERSWLAGHGVRFTPLVGWAERGDGRAGGHGNSVPRFHVPWGTGTGISEPFADRARDAAAAGNVAFHHRHRVDALIEEGGAVTGVRGTVLAPDGAARGVASSRVAVGEFELRAQAVVIATGGIGGNHEQVRRWWPERLGTPPATMITGVPAYVDGRMLDIAADAGVRLVGQPRPHVALYRGPDQLGPDLARPRDPDPARPVVDVVRRARSPVPPPGLPGYDTLGTLRLLRADPALAAYDHSWFVLTQRIIEKEFALSGSEQNPDITGRDLRLLLRTRLSSGAPAPVEAFKDHGVDFVVADDLRTLVAGMNELAGNQMLDHDDIRRQIEQRDAELTNRFAKDVQVQGIHNARRYLGDRRTRVATPHRILDPKAGPLIAVRLRIMTRKTLGGIQTDLAGRALGGTGAPIPGLYAAGEVAGFGGGGAHGYNALEGTFLGGCLFTGRTVGRSLPAAL